MVRRVFRRKNSAIHVWRPSALSSRKHVPQGLKDKANNAAHNLLKAIKWIGPAKLGVAIILGIILYQATKPVVIIEKFDVDPSIKEHVFSADELTLETQRAISEIAAENVIQYDRVLLVGAGDVPEIAGESSTAFRSSDQQSVDFQVPTVGLSYLTIQNLIRGFIGNEPIRVHIVIAKTDLDDMGGEDPDAKDDLLKPHVSGLIRLENTKLSADVSDSDIEVLDLPGKRAELSRDIAREAAKKIVKTTDPLTFAISRRRDDPTESMNLLKNIPPPNFKERFMAFFPWTEERHRQAVIHGFLGDELAIDESDAKRAEAELRLSYQLKPHPTIANNLGIFLYKQKRYPEAKEWLEKAVRVLPKQSFARSMSVAGLALILKDEGKPDEAIATMEEAARAWPDNDQNGAPYLELTILYEEKGNLPKAEANAREYLKLDPWDGNAYFALADILAKENQYAEAIKLLEFARDGKVGDPPKEVQRFRAYPMDKLGELLEHENGDPKKIEQAYRLAIEDYDYDPDAYLALADYLQRQKRTAEAIAVLKKGLDKTGTAGNPLKKALVELDPKT